MDEAYVYIQRCTDQADGHCKVGSHTGTPQKLWSRYKTYCGSNQEFKLTRTEPKYVKSYEKFVQIRLEQAGLHVENERFRSESWAQFDALAKECSMPEHGIYTLRLVDNFLNLGENMSEENEEDENVTCNNGRDIFLSYRTLETLSFHMFDVLESCNYRRIEGSGDIVKRWNNLPFHYETVMNAKAFVNTTFSTIPKFWSSPTYLPRLVKSLQSIDSIKSKFIRIDRNMISYRNGVLDTQTMSFTLTNDYIDNFTQSRFHDDRIYDNFINRPLSDVAPVFNEWLSLQFGESSEKKTFFMAMIGRLFFRVNQLDPWSWIINFYGPGRHFVQMILQAFQRYHRIGFIQDSKSSGKSEDHDIIIVLENYGINNHHPLWSQLMSTYDKLRGDELRIPFAIFSDDYLRISTCLGQQVSIELPCSNVISLQAQQELYTIVMICLNMYHSSRSTDLHNPFTPSVAQPVMAPKTLTDYLHECVEYNPNDDFGVSLKDLRSIYRSFVGPVYSRTVPLTEKSFVELNPHCTSTQPKKCQACNQIRRKGTAKCCEEYKESSMPFYIRYISIKTNIT